MNDAVHGGGHEAVGTSAVTEQQPSDEPTEIAYKPKPAQADAPAAKAEAADILAESSPAEAEPALAEAEPALAETEPAVAEAEPTVARAEPAVAEAEPAVAKAESTDSMPEWASMSEEAITADCKQHDNCQPASAEHVIADHCETDSPASDTAAADHVIHDDTDTADLAPKALVLEQDLLVDSTAGIQASTEGTIHLQRSLNCPYCGEDCQWHGQHYAYRHNSLKRDSPESKIGLDIQSMHTHCCSYS